MADKTEQAVSTFHDAITAFRKACGDDKDCAPIIVAADATERQIELAYPSEEKREKPGQPDESEKGESEKPVSRQPSTLKGAAVEARSRFSVERTRKNLHPARAAD